MQVEGDGVDKGAAHPHDEAPAPLPGDSVIQFAIFCCAVTMVIVLAVAFFAK